MVCELGTTPRLRFADDFNKGQLQNCLPLIHCRECGSTGWVGNKKETESKIDNDLKSIYLSYFGNDAKTVFVFPENGEETYSFSKGYLNRLCPTCLNVTGSQTAVNCPSCNGGVLIPVFMPKISRQYKGKVISDHNCPYCGSINSMVIVGSRATSLTSVLISQLFSSVYNDDKKLLTFSDSVQDAAHRAGFFGARTYRFNFRTAIQKFALNGGDGLNLVDFPDKFIEYWSGMMKENNYISTFLAPNMAWLNDYHYLMKHESLPHGSDLRDLVDKRIRWEIMGEYCFSSRIGRTLERTGSSIAHLSPGMFNELVPALLERLQNEIGSLRTLDEVTLRRFIVGLIVHLKNQGGVVQPILIDYINSWGNTYLITNSRINWMPGIGKGTRAPVFVTEKEPKQSDRFETLLRKSKQRATWYQRWAEKCFTPVNPFVVDEMEPIFKVVFAVLDKAGVLETFNVTGKSIWGIRQEALQVSCEVSQFECSKCRNSISVASIEDHLWEKAPCQRISCDGTYSKQKNSIDYYMKLYSSGELNRIFAEEHTGLLNRDEREDLEKRFKADKKEQKPWDPNLLSCTPTLEMGIDIGDLSSLILCSVPPSQANYLQRIGRAGRRDGNALSLTVANGKPHDLYFFEEPEEMIKGRVESPGVFLNASAVLSRQLTAFCFDRWVETGIPQQLIPVRIKDVLNNLKTVDIQNSPLISSDISNQMQPNFSMLS